MAWITFEQPEPTNHTPRTDDGAKGRAYPWGSGATAVREVLPGCIGCDNLTAHGSPCSRVGVERIAGERLEDDATAGQYASAETLVEIDSALWAAAFIGGANLSGNYLYNLGFGTANNVLQFETVRVTAVAGNLVSVVGRDPRRLTYGVSRVNPEWPLPDPITGSTARLQTDGIALSLPAGALFEPLEPSVLFGKLTPMVRRVIPPTGAFIAGTNAAYQLELWAGVNNLMQPRDIKFPPADDYYYARLGFMGIAPEQYANWQSYPVAHWTRKRLEVTGSEFTTLEGIVPLLNTEGEECRVLPRFAGSGVLVVRYSTGAGYATLSAPATDAALITVDTGTGWETTLDLSALLSEGITGLIVDYMPEAVAGDGAAIITAGSCANSQIDYSGSYIHGDGERRCNNVGCDKFQAGQFRDVCWGPRATGFHLRCAGGPGNDVFPAADVRDDGKLAEIAWSSVGTVIKQGLPGSASHRNFAFERRVRTGLQNLTGSFCDQLPASPGAGTVELMATRQWGQREVYTPEGGGQSHRLVFGLFDAAGDGSPQGAAPQFVDGWSTRTDALRQTKNTIERLFPSFGPQSTSVAEGTNGGGGMSRRVRKSAVNHQIYVTAINVDRVVPSVVAYAARIGGG